MSDKQGWRQAGWYEAAERCRDLADSRYLLAAALACAQGCKPYWPRPRKHHEALRLDGGAVEAWAWSLLRAPSTPAQLHAQVRSARAAARGRLEAIVNGDGPDLGPRPPTRTRVAAEITAAGAIRTLGAMVLDELDAEMKEAHVRSMWSGLCAVAAQSVGAVLRAHAVLEARSRFKGSRDDRRLGIEAIEVGVARRDADGNIVERCYAVVNRRLRPRLEREAGRRINAVVAGSRRPLVRKDFWDVEWLTTDGRSACECGTCGPSERFTCAACGVATPYCHGGTCCDWCNAVCAECWAGAHHLACIWHQEAS